MIALYALIPKWLLLLAVAGLSAATLKLGLSNNGLDRELSRVKVEAVEAESFYAAQQVENGIELARMTENYRAKEADLQALAETNRRLTDESIASSRAAAAGIRDRLRNTPALSPVSIAGDVPRATLAATAASYRPGSIGGQLRGQAGPLVDEAERADLLRAQLIQCRAMYEAAMAAKK